MNSDEIDLSIPDAECGSVEFLGWCGLYKDFPEEGWYMIKHESTTGSTSWSVHEESEMESVLRWGQIESHYEPEWDEPEVDDFVIQDLPQAGYQVSPSGEKFDEYALAVAHVRIKAAEDQFWPNVWFMDDHGGFRLISEEVFGKNE